MQDDSPDDEIERITQRIVERVMTSKARLSPEHYARIKAKEQGTGSFIDRFMIAEGAWRRLDEGLSCVCWLCRSAAGRAQWRRTG